MEFVFGQVTPLTILMVISGLVEVVKKVAEGEPMSWKFWLSLFLGIILGTGLTLSRAEIINSAVLFDALIYGILCGLVPTGLYDLVTKRIVGAVTDAIKES